MTARISRRKLLETMGLTAAASVLAACAPAAAPAPTAAVAPTAAAPATAAAAPTAAAAAPTAAEAAPTTAATAPTTAPAAGEIKTEGPFGGYAEPVPVTMMTYLRGWSEDEFKNSPWVTLLKEKFNIELDYQFLAPAGNAYDQGISLRMASGDLPDLMMVSILQLHQMVDAGLLEPLTGVWEEYASDQAKQYMTAASTYPFDVATIGGELYGIPEVQPPLEAVHALHINKQWIKDLELPQPDTWENFEKILYAFRENDPNGNGEKDEVPLVIQNTIWAPGYSPYEVSSLANAFGEYPAAWIDGDDGKVVYGSVRPGMKTVLEKLAQYYKDGILDAEFIVKDQTEAAKTVGEHRGGAAFGVQWTIFMDEAGRAYWDTAEDLTKLCWDADGEGWPLDPATTTCAWEAVPIPTVDGKEVSPIIYDKSKDFLVVKKGFAHPEIAVKFANYMHFMGIGPQAQGPEGYPYLGIVYADWRAAWDAWTSSPYRGETIHANMQRWDSWLTALSEENPDTTWIENNYLAVNTYHNWTNFYQDGPDMVNYVTGEKDPTVPAGQFKYRTCGQTFMYSKDLAAKNQLVWDRLGAYVTPSMVDNWATLQDLELEAFTRIITGQAPVDSFDEFVERWYALGGEQITTEVNEWVSSLG